MRSRTSPGAARVPRTARVAGAWLLVLAALTVLRAAGADVRLIEAVKSGNREIARALLQEHVNANSREVDGTTALHWAARSDDIEMVQLLLRAGADVDAANRYGLTPLSLAATNGGARVMAALLEAGADPNATQPAGETVLMTAARTGNPEAVKLLLARGADVHAKESGFGEDALMWAAADNHADVINLLVEKGADVNATATVLEFPKVKVDPATMVVTALPRGGLTPMMYAARQGSLGAARALSEAGADLNRTDPDGASAMVIAVINAHYDVAALLAEKGADPEIGDTSGMAALYAAVDMHTLDPMVNRPPPRTTGEMDAVDFVKTLLARKVNPDATLKAPLLARQHNAGDGALGAGATPLMRAAKNGDVTLMRVLIDHGADPNRTTRAGMTPLLFAMGPGRRKSAADTLEAVRICVDGGANVNATNANGETPLHVAVGQSDSLVRLLAEKGARLDARDKLGRTPLDVALGAGGAGAGGARGGRGGRGANAGGSRERTAALLRELIERGAAKNPEVR